MQRLGYTAQLPVYRAIERDEQGDRPVAPLSVAWRRELPRDKPPRIHFADECGQTLKDCGNGRRAQRGPRRWRLRGGKDPVVNRA